MKYLMSHDYLQRVEEEVDRRKLRNGEEIIELDSKPLYFSKFHSSLVEAARLQSFNENDLDGDLASSKSPPSNGAR